MSKKKHLINKYEWLAQSSYDISSQSYLNILLIRENSSQKKKHFEKLKLYVCYIG